MRPIMPEIDQREAAVVGEEDVAGMRIGVEHAVDDDLLQVRAHQRLGQLLARRCRAGSAD